MTGPAAMTVRRVATVPAMIARRAVTVIASAPPAIARRTVRRPT
jgi:hypothetical protein